MTGNASGRGCGWPDCPGSPGAPCGDCAKTGSLFQSDELWMLYDLVTKQKVAYDDAELEIRGPAGGEKWRLLHRKLRQMVEALPPPEVHS